MMTACVEVEARLRRQLEVDPAIVGLDARRFREGAVAEANVAVV